MNQRKRLIEILLVAAFSVTTALSLYGRAYSPWVVSEHVADLSGNWHSFMRHKAFLGKRDHDLAFAIWRYFSVRETGMVHTPAWEEPSLTTDSEGKPDPWGNLFTYAVLYDPVKNLNSFGMGFCGMQSVIMCGVFRSLGYESRSVNLNSGYSHEVMEVFYSGGWHFIDTDERGVVLNPAGELASWAQMKDHPEWWNHWPYADIPHFPVHRRFGELVKQGKVRERGYKYRWEPLGHTMDFVLRMGESFTRWWRADSTRYYVGWWNRPEGPGEWLRKNILDDPEHMLEHQQKGIYGIIYDRPGMGVFAYSPKLGSAWQDYEDGVYEDSNVKLDQNGVRALSGGGYAVFKVYTPYIIIGKNGPDPGAAPPADGAVIEYEANGGVKVWLSRDFGSRWDLVGQGSQGRIDATPKVYGRWGYLVKFEIEQGAVLQKISLTTWVQVNPMSLPRVTGKTSLRFRTGDRTGEKTAVQPLFADFSTTTDSLNSIAWLKVKNHRRFDLHNRSTGASAVVEPPQGCRIRWLTVGGDFNNDLKPEIWISTTGEKTGMRLLRRLEVPDWCGHWMSRLDEFLGPPDTIPGKLLVEFRKNVNNVRIYSHYAEPERPVQDSPVEITHCVGGVQSTLTVRADTTYTIYGEGDNQWIRMRVASERAREEKLKLSISLPAELQLDQALR